MRYPLGRLPGCSLLHHTVHLFKRETLGFRDQQIGVEETGGAEGAPDEEDFGAEVAFVLVDHVGGDDCNDLLQCCQRLLEVYCSGRRNGW